MEPVSARTTPLVPHSAAPSRPPAPQPPGETPVPAASRDAVGLGQTPALPPALQREALRPPAAPLMTRDQMVALLSAAITGAGAPLDDGRP
ncbi:MAG: hypothetical protein JWN57_1720 [Frankiales bacterium]|nr:hypothetical protein [Frankiales bacterium]